jgi:hypothetical protein
MSIAFAPRAGYSAESVGTVAVGDGTLNVTEALNEHGGVLVVPDSDTLLALVLDEHPALKRVGIPDTVDEVVDHLTDLPASALRQEAQDRGLKASGKADDLRAAIRAHDAANAGDTTTAGIVSAQED